MAMNNAQNFADKQPSFLSSASVKRAEQSAQAKRNIAESNSEFIHFTPF